MESSFYGHFSKAAEFFLKLVSSEKFIFIFEKFIFIFDPKMPSFVQKSESSRRETVFLILISLPDYPAVSYCPLIETEWPMATYAVCIWS